MITAAGKKAGKSLEEVHGSVDTTTGKNPFRKLLAFFGPAYLVSVGYMDPGNWATDIAGGSKFGYTLIWVLLMSNLMALLLQSLSARLGLVRGLDLAQASRETFPRPVNRVLWFLAEIAIASTDLAEVLGMAIGLQLLFGLDLLVGVSITVLDTFLLLFLLKLGMRKMEAFILTLIGIIGLAFIAEMIFAKPSGAELVLGFIPSIPNDEALYIAIGIIGATVMPHNLYLHSSLVQTRKFEKHSAGVKRAIRFNFFDSVIALNMAFFVNSAILVLAAAAFYTHGFAEVSEIQDAHKLLAPVLGTVAAPILFAVALIAAGQSSTLTGTLSGQIVMEGYLNLRIQPWLRRLITRLIAIIPAFITILVFGEEKTGELLVLSQVILSLQLGFAVIPLIHFVSDKKTMGEFTIKPVIQILAWISAIIIVSLNVRLVLSTVMDWIEGSENPVIIYATIIPLIIIAGCLLVYVSFFPLINKIRIPFTGTPHGDVAELDIADATRSHHANMYKRIVVTIDFTDSDSKAISQAIKQGGTSAEYLLIHIVETAGALMMKEDIDDYETGKDALNINQYVQQMQNNGFNASSKLGYGNPKQAIPEIVKECNADLLVMGAHGHGPLKDIAFGTTLEAVRHQVKIPVMIVRE